ncbi:E3 ubiquitin-protein ligase TRIM56-like isoform X2 [Babylonia areolata]|uniref:E3 ubiquitin-protein ligase TRIM56-like isoform X2 n=1 Tax=Babylonia areolata TaxID=304850 RepID=UPI003FD562E1
MAGKQDDTDLECPVCHDDFQDPKILPCTHLVCRKCIVSWVSKEGSQGGCPLCRAAILSSTPASDAELAAVVDALPTDLAIASVVENQKVLNSPHVCAVCDGKVAASAYCLQCNIKLCKPCAKGHTKIPYLQSHVVEDLNTLTVQQLAGTCRTYCKNHPDRLAELFCSSHEVLICMLCFPTNHRDCPEVKAIADIAQQKRAELDQRVGKLLEEEAKMVSEIQASKDDFKTLRKKVEDVFDTLEQHLQKRRQSLLAAIQTKEDASRESLSKVEKARASMKAHAGTMRNLTASASNDAILGMLGKLTSRLQGLEQSARTRCEKRPPVDVVFGRTEVDQLTKSIASLGMVGESIPGMTAEAADSSPRSEQLLQFHDIHGDNIVLGNNKTRATRVDEYYKALTFSRRPIAINERVHIQVTKTVIRWSGGLRIGFCSVDPAKMGALPSDYCSLPMYTGYWMKELDKEHLDRKISLYYFVTRTGRIFCSVDGQEPDLFLTDVDTSQPLWAVLDVYGKAEEVQFTLPGQ